MKAEVERWTIVENNVNLGATLEFVDSYLRRYISYVLSFFDGTSRKDEMERITDIEGRLVGYAIISAVLGIILQETFIEGTVASNIDFVRRLTIQFCFWVLMAVLIQLLVHGFQRARFSDSLSVALQVFPPAFLVGAFASFVALYATAFEPSLQYKASRIAANIDALVYCVVLACYLPNFLSKIARLKPSRIWFTTAILVLSVALVDFIMINRVPASTSNALATNMVRYTAQGLQS